MNESVTPEEARRRIVDAFALVNGVYVRQWREMIQAVKPLLDWAKTPEGRAVLAAAQAGREAEVSCTCFCGLNHPGQWPCEGIVLESEIVTVRFGDQDVPMCPPCAQAGAR